MQPSEISPGCKQMMVMRKRYFLPSGSYGTVSWDINGKQVIVMWAAPVNFDFYPNMLAVGITDSEDSKRSEGSYTQMRYEAKPYFVREKYVNSTRDIMRSDGDSLCVRGSMSTTHKPVIKILVYPVHQEDLARGL